MKRIYTLLLLCFALSGFTYAQSFHKDGSMILKKISKSKKYGFEGKHQTSIKVGSIDNEYAYMKSLCGPNGEEIQYRRSGSCCLFDTPNGPFGRGSLDRWEITYEGLKEPIVIYLNGYEYKGTPKCPRGLGIKKKNSGHEDLIAVRNN